MADFDNLFDAAIARADETIRGYMGTSATMTSGEQSGAVIRGVFDDPENISYAGQGVRVEGSSPSLFVRTDDVRQLRRGDTLTIGEENFWIDRIPRAPRWPTAPHGCIHSVFPAGYAEGGEGGELYASPDRGSG